MTVTIHRRQRQIIAAIIFYVVFIAFPFEGASRNARRTHTVQSGESVARIADFYGVSQRDLRELNKMQKREKLRVGEQILIPNVLRVTGKRYRVKKGDTLASIAAKHKCDVTSLANANKLGITDDLQIERTLVIPDRKASTKTIDIKKVKTDSILFLRVASGERERLRLYSTRGKMLSRSVQRLSYLARYKRGKQPVKRLNFRLVKMLQMVGTHFPGKPIEIISGYRPQSTGTESQHAFGRAMDFRVGGVRLRSVFEFCVTLPRSGCGFYPKSGFIHMDARESKASWRHPKKKSSKKDAGPQR